MSSLLAHAAAWTGPLLILAQVVLIDLVLAGDNAVAVGIAASGLEPRRRHMVIIAGLAAAVVLRIGLALIALQLLSIIGLLVAGGVVLLLVCWKMWRDLRASAKPAAGGPAKSFAAAFAQIIVADLSMSLDNVLAIAGAAHAHPAIMVFGLLLSIVLMGVAANAISRVLNRMRWIGYLGLVLVIYVALHMMWEGSRGVVVNLNIIDRYNAFMPDALDIKPDEAARRGKPK
jgi:YjbE family integral membrane protein